MYRISYNSTGVQNRLSQYRCTEPVTVKVYRTSYHSKYSAGVQNQLSESDLLAHLMTSVDVLHGAVAPAQPRLPALPGLLPHSDRGPEIIFISLCHRFLSEAEAGVVTIRGLGASGERGVAVLASSTLLSPRRSDGHRVT